MTDRDDDERSSGDDDPMLKSMRAVWLQMRDEDPPESGVAALLAAAREKADAMQPKEPWWQRAFAVLRRPPVLALASAAILVGGAVVITKRRDAMEAPPPVVSVNQEESGGSPPDDGADLKRRDRQGYDEGKSTGAKMKVDDTWAGADAGGAVESPPSQQPRPPASDGSAANGRTKPKPIETVPPPPPPPPPESPNKPMVPPRAHVDAPPQTGEAGLASGNEKIELDGRFETTTGNVTGSAPTKEPLAIAQDDANPKTDSENQHAKKSATKGADTGDDVRDAAPRPQPPRREVSIDQLVQQCESAATRGDCAAVRAMAGRIKKADPGAYRERLERNTKIARCLK